MGFERLGEAVYYPKILGSTLQGTRKVIYNYYLRTQIKGTFAYIDIKTKLFAKGKEYIQMVSYKVRIDEIEACVKKSLLQHMRKLGLEEEYIPKSLL